MHIALLIIEAYAWASTDGTIAKNGGYIDAGTTLVKLLATLTLKGSQIALTPVLRLNLSLSVSGYNELH